MHHYTPPPTGVPEQQPVYPPQNYGKPSRRPRRGGKFRRFIRGYLMIVGAMATLYVLVHLLVMLFVEIGKWTNGLPLL